MQSDTMEQDRFVSTATKNKMMKWCFSRGGSGSKSGSILSLGHTWVLQGFSQITDDSEVSGSMVAPGDKVQALSPKPK